MRKNEEKILTRKEITHEKISPLLPSVGAFEIHVLIDFKDLN